VARREQLLTYASVAEWLDCSDDTVRRLVKRGLLAAPKGYAGVGPRFTESDVLLYLARAEEARQEQEVRRRETQEDANSRDDEST
jgi:excisionase family DNA binding protein